MSGRVALRHSCTTSVTSPSQSGSGLAVLPQGYGVDASAKLEGTLFKACAATRYELPWAYRVGARLKGRCCMFVAGPWCKEYSAVGLSRRNGGIETGNMHTDTDLNIPVFRGQKSSSPAFSADFDNVAATLLRK